ncbi:alcohol dehydrogenase [Stachybotrys elegans]|uniref:Alcohol dehydrogenase n=1 Tax=Stachybotrys elegans TaxID=80388 RepID=A0A8K0WLX6_9HYPO|nr:alcohol dehydrogenase [Stachybotrys elegans]
MVPQALYVDENGAFLSRSDLPLVQAEEDELLVKVLYSGTNPADYKGPRFLGTRSSVLGNDFCGVVLDSPGVKKSEYNVGDIIAGYTTAGSPRPLRFGTHQQYTAVRLDAGTFKVPANLPLPDAAALTSVTQTASDAIFNRLKLPLPSGDNIPFDGTVVIWGGGTCVGYLAIQLARAAGATSIITTASLARHEALYNVGATICFDYNDPQVTEKVRSAIGSTTKIRGLEASGTSSELFLGALNGLSDDTRYVFVVLPPSRPQDEQARGVRHYDIHFSLPGGQQTLTEKARPEEADRMWKALMWAIAHYGDKISLPNVRVFNGTAEEALEQLEIVSQQGLHGKLVFKQPLE